MFEFMEFYLCNILGGTSGAATYTWPLAAWAGQPAGYGDGTGTTTIGCVGTIDGVNPVGTLVTNKFWMDDGKAHHLDNVAVRLQAVRDWMDSSNPITATPLNWQPSRQRVGDRDGRLRRGRAGQAYRSFSGKPVPNFTPLNWRASQQRPGERDRRLQRGRAGLSTHGRVNAAAGIISITPGPLAVNVAANVVVTVVFAQSMNASTITTTTFTLTGLASGAIAGTVAYTSGTLTATFTPTAVLSTDTYTIALSNSIQSSGTAAISTTSSSFQVAPGISSAPALRWFPGLWRPV